MAHLPLLLGCCLILPHCGQGKIQSAWERAFRFVDETVMSNLVEGLRHIDEDCSAIHFFFYSSFYVRDDSQNLLRSRLLGPEANSEVGYIRVWLDTLPEGSFSRRIEMIIPWNFIV